MVTLYKHNGNLLKDSGALAKHENCCCTYDLCDSGIDLEVTFDSNMTNTGAAGCSGVDCTGFNGNTYPLTAESGWNWNNGTSAGCRVINLHCIEGSCGGWDPPFADVAGVVAEQYDDGSPFPSLRRCFVGYKTAAGVSLPVTFENGENCDLCAIGYAQCGENGEATVDD